MPKKVIRPVMWLSEKLYDEDGCNYYEKFKFNNIVAAVGDYILVSNADAAEPDTEEGCDAAQIVSLYENSENISDPFRAKVQWYSRPIDLPVKFINGIKDINFEDNEVIEDHRAFDTDVSIETFFRTCCITKTSITVNTKELIKQAKPYNYICRYRLTAVSKRKFHIESILEEEGDPLELLCTPKKNRVSNTPKTPTSLTKKMSRVSLSEQKNWSVSKTNGTKMLLKRAIFTDKTEKSSPKTTPKRVTKSTDTPKSSKKLNEKEICEILSMELEENSDEEIPTLIIKTQTVTPQKETPKLKDTTSEQNVPKSRKLFRPPSMELKENSDGDIPTLIIRQQRTPKRKSSTSPNEVSPKKIQRRTSDSIRKSSRSRTQVVGKENLERTPPRSTRKRNMSEESDEDFVPKARTPRTPKPKTPSVRTSKRSAGRSIRTIQLTPSLQARATPINNKNMDEYIGDTKSLPGRENQMREILSFIRTKLIDGSSGCMYISGMPGTGKTATLNTSLDILKNEPGLPEFQLVDINGMKLAEPKQAYVQIYKQLTGKTIAWGQACALLTKRFTNPGPRRVPTVLLVDEMDALCTRKQEVLYNIVEWASRATARLSVVCVANTMDLPERALAPRVASRLGLTRLTFLPYSHSQLAAIVAARLVNRKLDPDAIQLIARKVASWSGDARRALSLCDRALELGGDSAGMAEVQKALYEASSTTTARAIRNCAPAEKLMLQAIASEVERTGLEETNLTRALNAAASLISVSGRPYRCAPHVRPPSHSQALAICARLASCGLLLLQTKGPETRLVLNASTDDVHYATRAQVK